MRPIPVLWSRTALDHAWVDHGVSEDELRKALADRHHCFFRSKGGRFKFIGKTADRIIVMILQDEGGCYRGKTAWVADATEKRLYRRR